VGIGLNESVFVRQGAKLSVEFLPLDSPDERFGLFVALGHTFSGLALGTGAKCRELPGEVTTPFAVVRHVQERFGRYGSTEMDGSAVGAA
jgi:hypothetical protein